MYRFSFATQIVTLAAGAFVAVPGWSFQSPGPSPEERARVMVLERAGGGSYLGIGVAEITAERAKALNLKEERGVEITRVQEGSPAEKGGLKTGDVVLEYNSERLEGLEQFMRMVRETPPGREVKLTLSRGGSTQTAIVKTGNRKNMAQTFEFPRWNAPEIRMPDVPRANMTWRSVALGVEAEALDESQLAQFFGVKEGVLVRSVMKGSSAERAGVRAGDVITKVDDTPVSNPREITSAIRSSSSRDSVVVTLVRDKREMTLTIPLDASSSEVPAKKAAAK